MAKPDALIPVPQPVKLPLPANALWIQRQQEMPEAITE
jgi:hypothetical protein